MWIRLPVRCYLVFLLAFGTFDHCMCSLPITRTDPHAYCFEYLARNHAKTCTSILLWVLVVPWVRKGQPWDHLNHSNVSLLCKKKKKKAQNQLSRVLRLPLISLYQISIMQNCVGPTSVGMSFPQVKKIAMGPAGPFLGRLFKACITPHNSISVTYPHWHSASVLRRCGNKNKVSFVSGVSPGPGLHSNIIPPHAPHWGGPLFPPVTEVVWMFLLCHVTELCWDILTTYSSSACGVMWEHTIMEYRTSTGFASNTQCLI